MKIITVSKSRNYSIAFYLIGLFWKLVNCNQCDCTCRRTGMLPSGGGSLGNQNIAKGESRRLGPPDPPPDANKEPGVDGDQPNPLKCSLLYPRENGEPYYGTLDRDYGCHKGYCCKGVWSYCLSGGTWCYTTKTYSQSFSYVTCGHSTECCAAWKCAGSCGF